MRLQGDTRVALTQGGKYAGMDFIGKTLSFDVNLSGVGCGCNLAMYMS